MAARLSPLNVTKRTATTTDLQPGESVQVPGIGRIPISAPAEALPSGLVVVHLAYGRLGIVADPTATWDTATAVPPIWRHRDCRACGGTGRAR